MQAPTIFLISIFPSGAPRLGYNPMGQRLRGVGSPALPCARKGPLASGVYNSELAATETVVPQVASTLNMKFKASCGRQLTEENLKFLAGKAFR
jgi:hypothetical protein